MDRFPSKINSLSHLNSFLNYEINTIIDIGVLTSTFELMRVYKTEKHVLVEPVSEFHETIIKNYQKSGINFDLLKIAASNSKGYQKLKKMVHLPALGEKYGVTASNLVFTPNQNLNDDDTVNVETDTLDNILFNYKGPFLIKIDVDGAEIKILEGATKLNDVYVVIIESWHNRISQLISIMQEKNFTLWDITDLCYMRGQLSQVDLVFVNNKLTNNKNYKEISPREFGYNSAQKGNFYLISEKNILDNKLKTQNLLSISKNGSLTESINNSNKSKYLSKHTKLKHFKPLLRPFKKLIKYYK